MTGLNLGWWYGERANLSLLMGAVWHSRSGAAMEEYTTEKGDGANRYAGRADAYVMIGCGNFSIEAKHHYMTLRTRQGEFDMAQTADRAIRDQTRNLDGANMSASVVFTVPHLPTLS